MKRSMAYALLVLMLFASSTSALAAEPRSRFYDFGETVINGSKRGPVLNIYGARQRVRFGRLLTLKKSFEKALYLSAKNSVFK